MMMMMMMMMMTLKKMGSICVANNKVLARMRQERNPEIQ